MVPAKNTPDCREMTPTWDLNSCCNLLTSACAVLLPGSNRPPQENRQKLGAQSTNGVISWRVLRQTPISPLFSVGTHVKQPNGQFQLADCSRAFLSQNGRPLCSQRKGSHK